MFERQSFTFDKAGLPVVVTRVLAELAALPTTQAVVLALKGDLGAGKTTFVQELARQLGVAEVVNSPTFTIMKAYETSNQTFTSLIHMDAYRIEDHSELKPLRFAELLLLPHTLLCIEWPEKIAEALPAYCLHISLTVVNESERTAQVEGGSV